MPFECRQFKQIPEDPQLRHFWSRKAFVEWINKTLEANYTNVLEFRNGAPYLHLTDALFPGVVPMESVKFSADLPYDCYQNFQILKAVFKKIGIKKDFDVDALSAGRHVETCSFLNWFKIFFTQNLINKNYDPIKARRGVYMGFGRKGLGQCKSKVEPKYEIERSNSLEYVFKSGEDDEGGDHVDAFKSKSQITVFKETLNTIVKVRKEEFKPEDPSIFKPKPVRSHQNRIAEKYEVRIPCPEYTAGKRVMITAIIEDFLHNHRYDREDYFRRFSDIIAEQNRSS